MKTYFLKFLTVLTLTTVSIWVSCGEQSGPLSPQDDQMIQSLDKKGDVPDVQVMEFYRMPTGKNAERLTVFVFYEKGGKGNGGDNGKKPPKDDGGGEETCSDLNTNTAYSLLGVAWSASGISVSYNPMFEPDVVSGTGFGAVDSAFSRWEMAVQNMGLINFNLNVDAPLPPERDGANVVGWRQLVGRDSRKVLAATYIWDDGTEILEADIVYNTAHEWAVNKSILPEDPTCGVDFDVEAIGVHEIGHLLGLGHVIDDGDGSNGDETDATMFGSAAKGELKKQTLTPGDKSGAIAVVPSPPSS